MCMCVCVCAMNSGFPIGAGVHTLNCTNFFEMKFKKKNVLGPLPLLLLCVMPVYVCGAVAVFVGFQKFLKSLFGIKAIPWNVNNSH